MLDAAIIGGGVAGCYCAFRLSAGAPNIALFEASNRIGGRLWSVPLADSAGPPAEIGGMFFRANQRNVRGLVEHLRLAHAPVTFKRTGQFARGVFFEDAAFASARLPFALAEEEQCNGPTALLLRALDKIAPGAAHLWPVNRKSPASAQATFDCLRGVRHHGRPLHEYSLWNVLAAAISNEAYLLLTSVLGSVSMLRNVNAFDGVWSLLHEIGDGGGYALRDGYQALPVELLARAKRKGARVFRNHRLDAVSRDGAGFRLRFKGPRGEVIDERAKRVILCLPQRALQRLDLSDELFVDAERFKACRDGAVLPMRSCKIFLSYERAWCNGVVLNEISARYTDLPMQQCYRWGAEGGAPAMLMAAYADDVSASFWTPLAQAGDTFPNTAADRAARRLLNAPAALVEAVQRQLATMSGEAQPQPSGALYFDWSREPFGAAWHGWAPHFKSWNIRPLMRRPNPRLDLFICGEAYSQRNGWVEGALNSAELALEQLGLTRPSWIGNPDFQFEVGVKGVDYDDCHTADVQRDVARHGAAA